MASRYSLTRIIYSAKSSIKLHPYIFSLLSVLFALLLQIIFSNIFNSITPFIIFGISVLLSSWYGGFGPGFIAVIESLVILGYFLVLQQQANPSLNTLHYHANMLIFFFQGILINLLSEARNKSEKEKEDFLLKEKIARRSAEQQARIRDHFISVTSHELKSPITSQKAYIQLLKKICQKNNQMNNITYLDKIENQNDKLTNFINDLLDVSKMKSKNLQYNFKNFQLEKCIQNAVDNISNLLVSHKISIHGNPHTTIYGDENRINQVLTNLLSNSIKYSPDASKIIIKIIQKRNKITIGVRDFGIGINPEFAKKIFNRFFRITGSDETQFKGFGLGLYISAHIIKKHKGKIWVESKEAKGSTFYFTIPLNQ